MQRMELALEGYMVAASQFPCPDTNGDGDATDEVIPDGGVAGNCTSYVGTLPYLSLGLSSGNDVWGQPGPICGIRQRPIPISTWI